jgi:hypothetical protein
VVEDNGFTEAEYSGAIATAFVQDAWRPTSDLTFKIGVRYDAVTYDDNEGSEVADMDKLQPRLGIALALTGDAKNVLRVSWGRFMHPGSLALPSWATTLETGFPRWYSCSGVVSLPTPDGWGVAIGSADECVSLAATLGWAYRSDNEGWDPFGWVLAPWEIYGSRPDQIVANLRATYAGELILAFEREVAKRSSIELALVDKKTRDVFDDTRNGNLPIPTEDAECDHFVFANLPQLRRDYRAFIVRYETRGLDWLTLVGSYTYSSSEGSVEYTQYRGEVADVYPWHFHNRYGYLSDHRRHRLKLNGFIDLRGDWTVAFFGFWASPFTWTPYEDTADNPEIPYGAHFLEPCGSRDGSSYYEIDLQLSKGFTVNRVRLVLIGSAYNVFSNEQPIAVCARISGCGDFKMDDATYWQIPRR